MPLLTVAGGLAQKFTTLPYWIFFCCLLWNDEANANIKPIYECRCNGRLQTKRSTRLSHTGLDLVVVQYCGISSYFYNFTTVYSCFFISGRRKFCDSTPWKKQLVYHSTKLKKCFHFSSTPCAISPHVLFQKFVVDPKSMTHTHRFWGHWKAQPSKAIIKLHEN
jgi:hypothetical protein